jgi:hypothetical protein
VIASDASDVIIAVVVPPSPDDDDDDDDDDVAFCVALVVACAWAKYGLTLAVVFVVACPPPSLSFSLRRDSRTRSEVVFDMSNS